MRFYNFEIVIKKEAEDEGYSAWSPSLPDCFSNGRTIEEARHNMREVPSSSTSPRWSPMATR
jgi:predicted RNase H-like HicB family nuclease